MPRTSLNKPYMKLTSQDALELLNTATVWDDMLGPPGSAGPAGGNPVYGKVYDNGAGSVGIFGYLFNDPGTEDDLMFDFQWSHRIKLGSTVYPHVHWSPTTTAVANVSWGIEYNEATIGEAFGNTTLPAVVSTATSGTTGSHQITSFVSIDKANRGISGIFKCRVYRAASGDTYTSDVVFHMFDIHFECDTLGSRQEFIK